MKSSICLIKINNGGGEVLGTGFFIKLPIPSKEKPMYGLMTNNHVLDFESIKPGNVVSVCINEFKKDIILNENNFIFSSELVDVTFIQLNNNVISDIIFNNPYLKFLNPCFNSCNEKDIIYIFQYPKGNLSYAKGRIHSISRFNYFHTASTEEGSSGSPLLNKNMEVIGIHKAGIENKKINLATKFNVVNYAIRALYNKSYINSIAKARAPTRELTEDEIKELKNHGLKKTESPNLYKCPYKNNSSQILLFYRTNHAWYYTTRNNGKINYNTIKFNPWSLINIYESIDEIIGHSNENLEHYHTLIIMWLKLSELKYM